MGMGLGKGMGMGKGMGVFLGIDVGTSSCKICIFNENGTPISFSRREYPLLFPRAGHMELSPDTVWDSVAGCVRECLSGLGGANGIAAVGVSSQGEAVMPIDVGGRALHNSIVTFDNRCKPQAGQIEMKLGGMRSLEITGAPVHSMFSLPKIMWFRENEPRIYENAWKFMCYGDFISYRLGADPCIDYTMASRTQMFDINARAWSDEVLSACGIDKQKLSRAVKSGEVIGTVSKAAAEATGLCEGTAIASGAHDQSCCALGAGVTKPGVLMDSVGTTESLLCIGERRVAGGAMATGGIPYCVYADDDLFAYLAFLTSCGAVLKWFKDVLLADETPYPEYDRAAAERKRPSKVRLLPYFAGSGTPHMDDMATGAFSGLTFDADRIDMYLAILEGTALESAKIVSIMRDLGIPADEIRCIGGGAKSGLWMQIKADAYGIPVTMMEASEAGVAGAAMLAVSAVQGRSLDDIAASWCRVRRIVEPSPEQHSLYAEMREHDML